MTLLCITLSCNIVKRCRASPTPPCAASWWRPPPAAWPSTAATASPCGAWPATSVRPPRSCTRTSRARRSARRGVAGGLPALRGRPRRAGDHRRPGGRLDRAGVALPPLRPHEPAPVPGRCSARASCRSTTGAPRTPRRRRPPSCSCSSASSGASPPGGGVVDDVWTAGDVIWAMVHGLVLIELPGYYEVLGRSPLATYEQALRRARRGHRRRPGAGGGVARRRPEAGHAGPAALTAKTRTCSSFVVRSPESPTGPPRRQSPMEFGVFAQLFVPKFERDAGPQRGAQAHHAQRRDRPGGRPERVQVRVVPAAPLPRRVQPHARTRRRSSATAPASPSGCTSGSAIFNITPPVNKPVRIAENVALLDHLVEQPLRVRHRPRQLHHRGQRLRHRRHRGDQGDVARGDQRDPEDVEEADLLLRGHLLPRARARGVPEAARPVAPGHVGGGRLARHLQRGRRARPRRLLLLHRLARPAPGARRQLQARDRQRHPGGRLRERQHHGRHQHALHGGPEEGLRGRRQHGHELLHEPHVPLARQHPEARRPAGVARARCPSPRRRWSSR